MQVVTVHGSPESRGTCPLRGGIPFENNETATAGATAPDSGVTGGQRAESVREHADNADRASSVCARLCDKERFSGRSLLAPSLRPNRRRPAETGLAREGPRDDAASPPGTVRSLQCQRHHNQAESLPGGFVTGSWRIRIEGPMTDSQGPLAAGAHDLPSGSVWVAPAATGHSSLGCGHSRSIREASSRMLLASGSDTRLRSQQCYA